MHKLIHSLKKQHIMRLIQIWFTCLMLFVAGALHAHVPPGYKKVKEVAPRGDEQCAASTAQIDQEINNVRARLLGGGDCWWDFTNGRYIVPKIDVATGQREVSSIFAGSVWLGGVDPGGNLKLACMDYRRANNNEFWPGPLNEQGLTTRSQCQQWNRHFRVTGEEIRRHLRNLEEGNLNPNDIPRGLRGWPATGNPFFVDVYGFDLPFTTQGLAGFYDSPVGPNANDGLYNPLDGDYPSIEIRGCPLDRYPDEMIFWIYNDQGGGAPHGNTNGRAIQMEVQVQAFGYVTSDELNDMTFQRYKLINRATELIDSTFFAMWIDPDLGCYLDDYIGCDTSKSLMYCYNQDALDGDPGCACVSGNVTVPTYCDKVPIIGCDYFRGPRRPIRIPDWENPGEFKDTLIEIGMSSFVYYNNPGIGPPPPGTEDPNVDIEFYRYLTGYWRDGTPFTYGGNGKGGTILTKYAFSDPPNDPAGWSMCTANLPFGDRRTLQASGPFRLLPGALNELIVGLPWVPDIDYPCPDLEQLFRADKLAQGLFDNCFERLEGPDAPNVDWIEMHQEIIAVLTNDDPLSNNFNERYAQQDFLAPDSLKNSPDAAERAKADYRFEGYIIYQVLNPNVSTADFTDPSRARIVAQVDIRNNVSKIYNWEEEPDPTNPENRLYVPKLMVDGENKGIRHTFSIKEDRFALGNDKRLVNHKKYYFSVIAYAHNEYAPFTALERPVKGQQLPFLPGSRNINIYTVIPRPVVDFSLQAAYGDGVAITRLQGSGAGGNFLDWNDETREAIWNAAAGQDTLLTYKTGRGPLTVTIFNPFEVVDGEYEIALVDGNITDNVLAPDARWELRRLNSTDDPVLSDRSIAELNEQIVAKYGFSVTVAQTPNSGDLQDDANGGIGAEIEYKDSDIRWLNGFPDTDFGLFNYVKTNRLEDDERFDPKQGLSTLGDGWFVPYALADWRIPAGPNLGDPRLITPAWNEMTNNLNRSALGTDAQRRQMLNRLRNVDIVLTPDKSKWSRCIVVETASVYYTSAAFPKINDLQPESPMPLTPANIRKSMDTRWALSVGKDDLDGDGLPDPDGATDPNGQPVYGMGWFPGYAVDVETGQRLNIFFGENSAWRKDIDPSFPQFTGRDMLWNPTADLTVGLSPFAPFGSGEYFNYPLGGQHFIYVAHTPYDECAALRSRFAPELQPNPTTAPSRKIAQITNLDWCGMLTLAPGFSMRPLRDGLVPTETRIKLRVDKSYRTGFVAGTNQRTAHPKYRFKIEDKERRNLDAAQVANSLDSIRVVPNPYYGFSSYEVNQFTNTVKITNLPGKCTVTIYSLDGKFIRQYVRNESYAPYQQITPAVEWDMRNSKGIPVASGVYLINVQAEGLGERTIKWFGVARQFDPSGL